MIQFKHFLGLALLAATCFSHAHVTVRNEANSLESISGKTDTYRLNVPQKFQQDVVSVRLLMPETAKFLFVEPVAGWKYSLEKDDAGKIVSVTYTGVSHPGELTRFPFILKNADKSDSVMTFKAYVTLKDGTVHPYDGSEAAKGYQPSIILK